LENVFKKLSDEERESVLLKGLKEKAFFVFKLPARIIKTKLLSLNRASYIMCSRPSSIHTLRTRQEVIVIMVLDGERYFFKSVAFIAEGALVFKRKVDFYHLIRRRDKRLKIPQAYPANLMIKRMNNGLAFLRSLMFDFSESGCRVGLNTELPKMEVGDELVGNLRMGDRRAVEVTGTVKHVTRSKSGAILQTLGLEFKFPEDQSPTQVKNLFLDLQRELFVEFYGKR